MRFKAPIYTYENILDKAGVYLKAEEEMAIQKKKEPSELSFELEEALDKEENSYSRLSLKELHKQLNNAVVNENYEIAAKIRDEISKRS